MAQSFADNRKDVRKSSPGETLLNDFFGAGLSKVGEKRGFGATVGQNSEKHCTITLVPVTGTLVL